MTKIYVFGNSHVRVFSRSKPSIDMGAREVSPDGKFISRVIGPTIAYNFYEHHYPCLLNFLQGESEFNKERDFVLLVVGEVDCRLHLVNQINKQVDRSSEDIVNECVDRFFRCHLDLKSKGYRVIGWGGHPSSVPEGEWTIGPYPNRLWIARQFEKRLKQRCQENDILFKSIFDSILTSEDLPDTSKFLDYCHLDPTTVSEIIEKVFEEELR